MPHHIAFVLFPGFQQLDLAGPMAAFEVASLAKPGSYSWRLVASRAGAVSSSAGVAWPVQGLPRRFDGIDLVMVIGGDGVDAASQDAKLKRWLERAAATVAAVPPIPAPTASASRTAGQSGPSITSICSGSLLLASAGLLDGRSATTHWSRQRQFEAHYPRVKLLPDHIYVHEPAVRGRTRSAPELWTSAGMTAGIDLSMALIAHHHGEALAREVARQLVVERRRPGGQTQFSSLLELAKPEGRFGALIEHVRKNLALPHTVDDLAAWACMSPRHFARSFLSETGTTPAQAVERLRVEAARAALESGAGSVQTVASHCGFGSAERMRRAFHRRVGRAPAALRSARGRKF